MSSNVPADARQEIKFVATESDTHRLRHWLRLHAADFHIPYPDRWVNNVYFDTHDCSAYSDNISGASYRTKLRYRWYGQSDYPQDGNLEIKFKRNYFGWKRRFLCPKSPWVDGLYWRDIRRNLGEMLGVEAKIWLEARPNPTILNRYYREYFVTRDTKIRVTIDSRQRVYDQRYKPYPNIIHETNIPKTMVFEIKFNRADRNLASRLIQGLPIRVSRNSKYVSGLKSMLWF